MDSIGTSDPAGRRPLDLDAEKVGAIKGRNAWVIWSAGNEAWWDWLARYGYGSIDLLKLIDSDDRETRFARTGLVNEPGTRPPTEEETEEAYGVRYDRPVHAARRRHPGRKVHVEYRKDRAAGLDTGRPEGVRLPDRRRRAAAVPEPGVHAAAQGGGRRTCSLYYSDTDEGRRTRPARTPSARSAWG